MNEEKNVNNQEKIEEQAENKTEQASQSQDRKENVNKDDNDIQENKVIAALSYLGILVLIPLLAKKDSKFAQFHAKQGVVLLIAFVVGWTIFWIPVIGWLLWLAVVLADVVALIKTLSGEYWEIPVVGNLAKKLNL